MLDVEAKRDDFLPFGSHVLPGGTNDEIVLIVLVHLRLHEEVRVFLALPLVIVYE